LRRSTRFLILSLATLVILVTGLVVFNYIPDDTFITLRYAQNVLRGDGFVFNPGERVEGYTNFLWLLILVATGKLGLALVPLARALSLAFSLGTLVLAGAAARREAVRAGGGRTSGSEGWSGAIGVFLPPMLLAASPPFLVWSLSGSEMPLFTFLLLAGFMLLRTVERPSAALVVFGLLGLVRPEGALFFAIALCYLLVRSPRKRAVLAAGVGVVAIFYAPYLMWKWRYFHALIPNTFYAKTGPPGLMIENGARYTAGFFLNYGYLLAAGIALLRAAGRTRERWLLPLVLAAASGLEVLFLGGDWMPHYRLLLPTLPLIMLVASGGAVAAAKRARRAPAFGLMLVLLATVPGAFNYDLFATERLTVRAFSRLGRRLPDILPGNTTIGCGSTGAIGYYSGMRIVDILGLTEPPIARRGIVVGTQPGHLKTDGAYVFSRRPDLLLLGNVQIHRGELGREAMPLKVQEIPIIDQPGFEETYDFVNIPLGGGFYLSCFKLKSYFLPLAPSASGSTPNASRR
jgi:arabinofuranosyltransferase